MPLRFIFGLVFLAIAGIAYLISRGTKNQEYEKAKEDSEISRIVAYICGGLAVCLILSACVTIVGTRRIGVVTDFGKPVDSLANGLGFKSPWQMVNELDGSIQTDSYVLNENEGTVCIDIRIGNESTACVDVTARWRIVTSGATDLYRDFRTMDNIRESLVTRDLTSALNAVLGDFNPLDAVNLDSDNGQSNLDQLAVEVEENLRNRVEDRVEILSVTLPLIRYESNTQEVLDDYATEIGRTRVAEQRLATAEAQAEANQALAESVTNDPNVLVSRCIESIFAMIEADMQVPPALNCWPGEGSAVVIPTTAPVPS